MSLTRFFSAMITMAFCLAALSIGAKADTITFTAVLSGTNEVPARQSAGSGLATLVLDDATGKAVLTVTFKDLTTALTGAHIHGAALPTANAPVIQGFDSALNLSADKRSGSLTNWALPITLTAQQIADLKAGLWYVNIHSTTFTGGEIRGQLYAVPEPGTLLLLGAGLLSVTGALKKRRAKN